MVICLPANSFRALCGISEWTRSSVTLSDSSLFGRPYGMEALRLSSGLTSKHRQRCPRPRWFPYSKFCFHVQSANIFCSSVHIRGPFAHPGSRAFHSSLSCWLWQVGLQWQSPLSSPDKATGSVQGAGDIIHYCSQLSCFGLVVVKQLSAETVRAVQGVNCWIRHLPRVSFTISFPNPVPGKVGSDFFCLKTMIFCSSDMRGKG